MNTKENVGWAIGIGGPANHYGGVGGIGFRQSIGSTQHITRMVIDGDGKVGIGTPTPKTELHVVGDTDVEMRVSTTGTDAETAVLQIKKSNTCWAIGTGGPGTHYGGIGGIGFRQSLGSTQHITRMVINRDGNVGIGTTAPGAKLHVAGRTKTSVLEITGGSDLAEPFEISDIDSLPKGSLVVIDKNHPGKLKQSTQAYDNCVAGVISGAGGINPGLTLSQEDKFTGGQHVALTGKVYALATTSNGPIEPGDLLTTSNVPGHAMKATDRERAFGAVIGKAMSGLTTGEGLVLVLIQAH